MSAITVATDTLSAAVRLACRAVPAKSPLPVLSLLRLDPGLEQNTLRVTATDLATSIEVAVHADVPEGGPVCIPARLFGDWLASFKGGEVRLTATDQHLEARCGTSTARFARSSAEDFPAWPETELGTGSIPAGDLQWMLGAVLPAAATDATRPTLAGILWETRDDALQLAAADGFRLMTTSLATDAVLPPTIVPAPALKLLLAVLAGETADTPVRFGVTAKANVIAFGTDRVTLASRLTEGAYPDYRRIIPQEPPAEATLPADELLLALRTVSPFARSNSRIVRIAGDDDTLRLESRDGNELGDATATVMADLSAAVSVSVNAGYLAEALAPFAGGSVTIGTSGPTSPIKISAPDHPVVGVVMPMHRSDGAAV